MASNGSEEVKPSTARDDKLSLLLETIGRTQDETAFAKLFYHYSPQIRGFLQSSAKMRMPADAAEELVQEVMVKVWQKAGEFDAKKASASTWIFTITRNARIDYIRKNARHTVNVEPLVSEDIWDEANDNQPFIYLQQARSRSDVANRLRDLPEEQAVCLKKVYMEGKTHQEISEELALPLGTVKSRVRLGLKKLQANAEGV